ncbi:MAG: TetR/AcrR family transcriptional regulator [Firmicutes bacterium]|nr:TetR/AcrR family transcriptional regulator [Bacillota bacterium]
MQVLKESVKNAIVEGAIAEFFERGYQNANMRRIADSANITVGNIYRYFENKEALFNAVLLPAQNAINDLESFDRKLHITQIESKKEADQIVTYVMNVLRPYTKEIFIMIFNSNGTHYHQVKNQLELLVVNKIREYFPGKFEDYFLKIVASSFIQALFVVFKDNVNNMEKIQDMVVQLIVFYFRDVNKRLF